MVASVLMLSMASCSDDNDETSVDGYGYLQVKLQKLVTRSLVEGNELDKLSDAKKIKLSLRYNGKTIEQTLNLESVSAEGAEFELTSENLKLRNGEYLLLGYAIYGDYNSGDMAEVLQVVQMDETTRITIEKDALTQHTLMVEAKDYGKFSAHIIRLEPELETRAGAPIYSEMFDYDAIDSVQLVLERSVAGTTFREDRKVKAYKGKGDAPVFETDSISLQTGDYKISHFELFNRRGQFMYAQDVDINFSVKHFELTKADVGVQLPTTAGTRDGIILKQIWDAMDGENWSFHDQDGYGGNWIFKMSDGSPRPLSAWVRQVGVVVNSTGRVISLNLGAFNPMGEVPDAIGQLDALEKLYLGEHTDEVYYTLEGVGDMHYTISPYILSKTTDIREHRMDIARERSFIRSLNAQTSEVNPFVADYNSKKVKSLKYATASVQTGSYDPANRITGISEEIGKLTNLQELYIANTLITKLPLSIGKLANVTDLELYNNPLTELDGDIFKDMAYLASVNIDRLYNLKEDDFLAAMDKMCEYCPKIQLLYINNMKLTKVPSKLNRLTDLRLLDLSHNKIKSMPSLLPMAPIQVILNYNELESLPADFVKIDDIESFSCTDNKLKEFPAVLSNLEGLYSFEKVDLKGNRIHGFQLGFKGIRCEQLLLATNYLGRRPGDAGKGEMPREFADTKSIINYLDLAYNNIDTIRNAAIKNLTSLQALDLSKNDLRSLPSGFNAENFPWLTGLDISHNRFDGFPNNVLNILSLTQLLVADQGYFIDEAQTHWVRTMTEWPTYLHLHSSLVTVNLSGNDFRTVVNFPTNLNSLDIRDNPNIKITVPQDVQYRILHGLFQFLYTDSQDVIYE